jgi:ribulose-5-phosphate 4-epimerase/fuculose-1-phosphate aldolase
MSHTAVQAYSNLAVAGETFYRRGWTLGASGNFSAVLAREPLRLVITPSGVSTSALQKEHFLVVDHSNQVLKGEGTRLRGRRSACGNLRIPLERRGGLSHSLRVGHVPLGTLRS